MRVSGGMAGVCFCLIDSRRRDSLSSSSASSSVCCFSVCLTVCLYSSFLLSLSFCFCLPPPPCLDVSCFSSLSLALAFLFRESLLFISLQTISPLAGVSRVITTCCHLCVENICLYFLSFDLYTLNLDPPSRQASPTHVCEPLRQL